MLVKDGVRKSLACLKKDAFEGSFPLRSRPCQGAAGALSCPRFWENRRENAPLGPAFSTPWDGPPSDYKTAALPTELRWHARKHIHNNDLRKLSTPYYLGKMRS
jgi:hypothetical protein